jgi:hypothetical protein
MSSGYGIGPEQVKLVAISAFADDDLQETEKAVLGPPEGVDSSEIYALYRGATGNVDGVQTKVWVEFPSLQLCWAEYDRPASNRSRFLLLELGSCRWQACSPTSGVSSQVHVDHEDGELLKVEVWSLGRRREDSRPSSESIGKSCKEPLSSTHASSASSHEARTPKESAEHEKVSEGIGIPSGVTPTELVLAMYGCSNALRDFATSLQKLLASRDVEGRSGLEFIQRRLFQYLWRHQGDSFTETALYEAQAVLTFNLDPKGGVAYLKEKLGIKTNDQVGHWLAQMSTQKGGLDPTLLGNYFSRMDTIEVFKAFVRQLDFTGVDLVSALRRLFDTFKPGGEGQVINRILELFAETYFSQWSLNKDKCVPATNYSHHDTVMATAFSLIMLNTELHVAPKKAKKGAGTLPPMTPEVFVEMARRVVQADEVPEATLISWYAAVKEDEISMQPMPRVAFSQLPVQPDIEGWLLVVMDAHQQRRYWAVLALQRIYLFSDDSDVEPAEAIDLKDATAIPVSANVASRKRFLADFQSHSRTCFCFLQSRAGVRQSIRDFDVAEVQGRAFEVQKKGQAVLLQKLMPKPRSRVALVAESADLMEKWVSLIDSGPY